MQDLSQERSGFDDKESESQSDDEDIDSISIEDGIEKYVNPATKVESSAKGFDQTASCLLQPDKDNSKWCITFYIRSKQTSHT